jgi:para-nitrobenzyl esterase
MMDALIAFARTGDPNTPAVHWPKWAPQNERLIEFGDAVKVLPMNTARLNFMAAHPPAAATPRAARD